MADLEAELQRFEEELAGSTGTILPPKHANGVYHAQAAPQAQALPALQQLPGPALPHFQQSLPGPPPLARPPGPPATGLPGPPPLARPSFPGGPGAPNQGPSSMHPPPFQPPFYAQQRPPQQQFAPPGMQSGQPAQPQFHPPGPQAFPGQPRPFPAPFAAAPGMPMMPAAAAHSVNASGYDPSTMAAIRAAFYANPVASGAPSASGAAANAASAAPADAAKLKEVKDALEKEKKASKPKGVPRAAAGKKWYDPTLTEWPANDYRIFVGDLGNEVNDDTLAKAFSHYPSFQKAKIVRDKHSNKSKGYGFVSLSNMAEGAKALKEMNGKYIGNRPCKLRKSSWEERSAAPQHGGKRKGGPDSGPKPKKAGVLHK